MDFASPMATGISSWHGSWGYGCQARDDSGVNIYHFGMSRSGMRSWLIFTNWVCEASLCIYTPCFFADALRHTVTRALPPAALRALGASPRYAAARQRSPSA